MATWKRPAVGSGWVAKDGLLAVYAKGTGSLYAWDLYSAGKHTASGHAANLTDAKTKGMKALNTAIASRKGSNNG